MSAHNSFLNPQFFSVTTRPSGRTKIFGRLAPSFPYFALGLSAHELTNSRLRDCGMEIYHPLEVRCGMNRTCYSAWIGGLPFLRPGLKYGDLCSDSRQRPLSVFGTESSDAESPRSPFHQLWLRCPRGQKGQRMASLRTQSPVC